MKMGLSLIILNTFHLGSDAEQQFLSKGGRCRRAGLQHHVEAERGHITLREREDKGFCIYLLGEMKSEVFVAKLGGSGAGSLTNHPAFDCLPSWSPDGTRIAFASNRNPSYQIFIVNADGSDVRLLANTEGRATAPQWGRDGMRIYPRFAKTLIPGVTAKSLPYGRRALSGEATTLRRLVQWKLIDLLICSSPRQRQ
jgi:hypothetical protein